MERRSMCIDHSFVSPWIVMSLYFEMPGPYLPTQLFFLFDRVCVCVCVCVLSFFVNLFFETHKSFDALVYLTVSFFFLSFFLLLFFLSLSFQLACSYFVFVTSLSLFLSLSLSLWGMATAMLVLGCLFRLAAHMSLLFDGISLLSALLWPLSFKSKCFEGQRRKKQSTILIVLPLS